MNLTYIEHSKIDFQKWDQTINKSVNGLVYAYSWYLNIVSPEWDAIIESDYDTVMPVTVSKKAGLTFFIQPLLTQQLGVFSRSVLSSEMVDEFLIFAKEKFRYINININKFNKINSDKYKVKDLVTFELELISLYDKLYKKYSTNTKRNIKNALKNKISVINAITPNQMIDLLKDNLGEKIAELNDSIYNNMRKIASFSLQHGLAELIGAYTEKNELCSAGFFITTNNKSIFLFGGSTPEGKEKSAMFMIIDNFIRKYSEKNIILDFEGSNIPGLARFYGGFGASPSKYINLTINNLPWYLKLIKK
ncbi:MAG: hypothetical protein ABIJ97_05210 [Bacteroidota bacterium]